MKRYFVALLCIFIYTTSQAQDTIKTYDEFFLANMQKTEGVFPTYILDNDIYIEIPNLYIDREIEIFAQIDRGFDLLNRHIDGLGVVRITMTKDEAIHFQQPFYAERILDNNHQYHTAFSLSNVEPKGRAYPIVAYSKEKGFIINITDDLLNGDDWFHYDYQFIRSLNQPLSKVINIHPEKESVSFTIRRYHDAESERYVFSSSNVILPSGCMPLDITCTLRLLPDKEDKLRLSDYRIPFKSLKFKDYSQDPYNMVEDSLILRWDFSKPITFYVDSLFPKEYLQAVKEGVLIWNKAFVKAGIDTPLKVKYVDKETVSGAQQALISYDLKMPGVRSNITYHPRTGEILTCRINLGHGFINELLTNYLLTCGASDLRIRKDIYSKEVEKELLSYKIAQEMGFVLGLNKNLLEDTCGNKLLLSKACYNAIYFGYKSIKGDNNCYKEREILGDWIDRLPANSIFHTTNGNPKWQVISDIDYDSKMLNLQSVVSGLGIDIYKGRGRDNNRTLINLYNRSIKLYASYLKEIAASVGSNQPGYIQLQAMSLIDKYLFNSDNIMESTYMKEELLVNKNNLLFLELKTFFLQLTSKETINALQLQGLKNDYGYCDVDFFQNIYNGLFNNFDQCIEVSNHQMDLQLLFIDSWTNNIQKNDKQSDYVQLSSVKLEELYNKLKELSTSHPQGDVRKMYRLLRKRISTVI